MRAVLRLPAFDGHFAADRERLPGPPLARQRVRRAALALPRRNLAVRLFHVDVDPDVGALPLDFRDDAFERQRFRAVEFGGEGMMPERRGEEEQIREGHRSTSKVHHQGWTTADTSRARVYRQ